MIAMRCRFMQPWCDLIRDTLLIGNQMRHQRNDTKGSRVKGLGHPNPTRHTAESYRARCKTARLTYLLRLRRMERREARESNR
jgi:hypothetical protein